jgi:23S rRNA (cytidine1920-2'-O)/16S rRNA (cytidine1409-2'-O)-methyltransferase
MAKHKERADVLLVERELVPSRARAQALIMAGRVFRGGAERVNKPGERIAMDEALTVKEGSRFVSRGGDKLDAALKVFAASGLEVAGKRCADVGASTGGFTDCLLQRGAAHVEAIDVGYGQLHAKLRSDPRVTIRERTNARHLRRADFDAPFDLVVVDASFISIGKLIDAIASILGDAGELVALVKPQFEAGREAVSKGRGVIRDEAVRAAAIARAFEAITGRGFSVIAEIESPVHGPKGNVEQLVYARLDGERISEEGTGTPRSQSDR